MIPSPRILIVDDDPIIVRIYRETFRKNDFQVEVAADAPTAIEIVRSNPPDLVLLDLFLGKVPGVEVLRFIRSRAETFDLPVIGFSTSAKSRYVDTAWRLGVTYCACKEDYGPIELLALTRKTLTEAQARRPAPPTGPNSFSFEDREAPRAANPEPDNTPAESVKTVHIAAAAQLRSDLRLRLSRLLEEGVTDKALRAAHLAGLLQTAEQVARNAEMLRLTKLGCLAGAVISLIHEMEAAPDTVTTSCLRTLAHAVELMAVLLERETQQPAEVLPPSIILSLDEQEAVHDSIAFALAKANVRVLKLKEPFLTLRFLQQNSCDTVFIDTELTGQNGFELCGKIREMPLNKNSPVVLVLGVGGLETQSPSDLRGVNEFLEKPFRPEEWVVKALTLLWKSRINPVPEESAAGPLSLEKLCAETTGVL